MPKSPFEGFKPVNVSFSPEKKEKSPAEPDPGLLNSLPELKGNAEKLQKFDQLLNHVGGHMSSSFFTDYPMEKFQGDTELVAKIRTYLDETDYAKAQDLFPDTAQALEKYWNS